MNTTPSTMPSPQQAAAGTSHATEQSKALVWDAPQRVTHWLIALSVAGAWLTSESERLALWHQTLGYLAAGLAAFRVLWGLMGSRYARFADFVRCPQTIGRYLLALLRGQAPHHVGHNPAGGAVMVLLLGLLLLMGLSGYAVSHELGGHLLEELHEGLANFMLTLVGVHVAAALLMSWLHRSNLVAAMFSGRKPAPLNEAIPHAHLALGIVIGLIAVAFVWWSVRAA